MDLGTGWVTDPCHPDWSWMTHDLPWWQRALTGECVKCDAPTVAKIEGVGLRYQHGPNPEHSKWFDLDTLNFAGCPFEYEAWREWLNTLHAYESGELWWMGSGGLSSGSGSSEPSGEPSESSS